MKRFKIIMLTLALVGAALLFCPMNPVSAATNLTVQEGKTKKITGTYFGTTDASIATVSKKGKIKGISEGTCQIIAIDSKRNAEIYNVTVTPKTSGTVKIDPKGWKCPDQVFNASGVNIILNKTTVKELYELCEGTSLEVVDKNGVKYNLETKTIMSGKTSAYIIDRGGERGQFKYYITCSPTSTKYYKDMIITEIMVCNADTAWHSWNTKTDTPCTDYFWMKSTFSPENAPAYESFKKQMLKKFSGEAKDIDKNITIKAYGDTNFKVWVKMYELPEKYINGQGERTTSYKNKTYYGLFTYYYDADTRECAHVDFYITTDRP